MRINTTTVCAAAALAASLLVAPARAIEAQSFSAVLLGDNEVPPTNSNGKATFQMKIASSGSITFTLTYSGLSGNPAVAHLHFGQNRVAGGVMIFLCGGGGQPNCPAATSGTITGTITSANVTGPTAQCIDPGDLMSALEAVGDGISYANMHTAKYPAGEIRGQVVRIGRHDHD